MLWERRGGDWWLRQGVGKVKKEKAVNLEDRPPCGAQENLVDGQARSTNQRGKSFPVGEEAS